MPVVVMYSRKGEEVTTVAPCWAACAVLIATCLSHTSFAHVATLVPCWAACAEKLCSDAFALALVRLFFFPAKIVSR